MKRLVLTAVLVATSVSSFAQIPSQEREALIALYNSTDGANWLYNDGWLGAVGTECRWVGVYCEGGHVLGFYGSSGQMRGTIPPELGNLSYMIDLRMAANELSGSIPPEFGNLTSLEYLDLSENQLSGSLPPSFGNLSRLQRALLDVNQLSGIPTELGNLSRLEYLYLQHNRLSGSIPPELGNLTNLEALMLWDNQLSGPIPPELGNLTSLLYLWLNDNRLSGSIPLELGNLSSVKKMLLRSNQLSGSVPQELGDLSSLEGLHLDSNQLVGELPESLLNLDALEPDHLDLAYNGLYTDNANLQEFLSSKDPDWQDTQTIAPANVTADAGESGSVDLSWSPITFAEYSGGYRVFFSEDSDGSYSVFGETQDKTASSMTVDGLTPGNDYFFLLRTFTDSGEHNTNTVVSDPSEIVTTAVGCRLVVGRPNGGEVWRQGEEVNIRWTVQGTGCTETVRIDLNRGGVFDRLIDSSADNEGSYFWTVPPSVPDGDDYQVRIIGGVDQSATDESDGFFSIGSGVGDVGFTWWPPVPREQQSVRLADLSFGSPISWAWRFGDGSTSSEKNPSHSFLSPGAYLVTLTVGYQTGTAQAVASITVAAGAPECGDSICDADETAWNCEEDCGLPDQDSGRTGGADVKSLLPAAVGGVAGVGNTFWLTEGMFFNPNGSPTTYVVEFIDSDELNTVLQAGPFDLEPESAVYHENLIEELFDVSGGGSIWIDSAEPLILNTRTYNQTDNGTYGQGISAIRKRMSLGEGDGPVYLSGISENGRFRSNLFILEAGIASATVTITVYRSDGTVVGSTSKGIAHHGRFEGRFRSSALFRGLELSQGYATVEVAGNGQVSAIASVVDEITGDATTVDAVHAQQVLGTPKSNHDAASDTHLLVAVVARVPGLENTIWRSDLTVLSPAECAAQQTVELEFWQTGTIAGRTTTRTIQPGEQLSMTDVIGALWPEVGDGAGSLHIAAPLGVIVSTRTYNLRSDNGTLGQSMPGLAGGEVARSGETWVLDLLKNNDEYRCNIGFSEYSGEDARVKISLYDIAGPVRVFLGSKTYDVQAFANTQINGVFENIGVEGSHDAAIAYAQVISENGAVYFYASVVDNTTGDANTILAKSR